MFKQFIASIALGAAVLGFTGASFAQAPAPATAAPAASAAAAAAPAAAASAAATPAPVPNKGDVSWMLVSTALVIMMSIPGLALFYGGLVRSKNMLSVLMQVFVIFSLIVVLWVVYGYSLAFTAGNPYVGGLSRTIPQWRVRPGEGRFATVGTFSKGVVLAGNRVRRLPGHVRGHHLLPDRRRLRRAHQVLGGAAVLTLWFTFSLRCRSRTWSGSGPARMPITGKEVVDKLNGTAGLLWQWGALDFAGGTVVHINAAVAGLVGAFMIGKRVGYGKESMTPHSLTLTMVGASLLWVGWFGFNAGSALEAGNSAALAFLNTFSPRRWRCWPGPSVSR